MRGRDDGDMEIGPRRGIPTPRPPFVFPVAPPGEYWVELQAGGIFPRHDFGRDPSSPPALLHGAVQQADWDAFILNCTVHAKGFWTAGPRRRRCAAVVGNFVLVAGIVCVATKQVNFLEAFAAFLLLLLAVALFLRFVLRRNSQVDARLRAFVAAAPLHVLLRPRGFSLAYEVEHVDFCAALRRQYRQASSRKLRFAKANAVGLV
ncbi:hypothetical protein M885DRAFT_534947 [Pelagophyceae sp. CCMP2097]|nr:hypothetical protein M885DRAFT_534947 [Pelagophyceae sp. CCMP2097]